MYSRALKIIRLYCGLSQSNLAQEIGITRFSINEIEKGRKKPSIDIIKKYAKRFDMPLSLLLLFAEQANKTKYEKIRVFFADKVLKILEWIAKDQDAEKMSTYQL